MIPKLRVNRGNIGNELFIHLPDLDSFEKTFLSGDEALAQTELSVISGKNFAADDYVLIGLPGTEKCELRKVASQTDTTVTTDALDFAHPKGTILIVIPFNQIEISSATAVGGTYSVASTIDITPDKLETYNNIEADASTKAYKVRFKNATDTTYSDYSDEITGAGYADNTVFAIKERALEQMSEKIGGILTDKKLNNALWQARREVDSMVKKWSFRTAFNSVIGIITEGGWKVAVPSDLQAPDSPDNILGLRIGNEGTPITYVSKRTFDIHYRGAAHATLGTQAIATDTSIELDSTIGSGDFDESGSLKIGADDLTYTANNESTETLSGIPASGTGAVTETHAVGTDVWQDVGYGLPYEYTIFENYIYFNCPIDGDYEDENIFMDYYTVMPEYNSDSDVLDEPEYDMFVHYLKAIIRQIKSKGKVNFSKDPDYLTFKEKAKMMAYKDRHNQTVQFVPDIGHLDTE